MKVLICSSFGVFQFLLCRVRHRYFGQSDLLLPLLGHLLDRPKYLILLVALLKTLMDLVPFYFLLLAQREKVRQVLLVVYRNRLQ
jgi:hypothetical protein